jgi:hypothetical protein
MNKKTKLDDYTEAEKAAFDDMHRALATYNAQLGAGDEVTTPNYSDDEMADYSRFREILLTERAQQR